LRYWNRDWSTIIGTVGFFVVGKGVDNSIVDTEQFGKRSVATRNKGQFKAGGIGTVQKYIEDVIEGNTSLRSEKNHLELEP
jgi:hypothetical protein